MFTSEDLHLEKSEWKVWIVNTRQRESIEREYNHADCKEMAQGLI